MEDCKEHEWRFIADRPTAMPGQDAIKTMTIEWCPKCGCLGIGNLIGWEDGRDVFSPRTGCDKYKAESFLKTT